jgi:hypothetical protein
MSLENIDTSYWLTKNKAWMDARKADWPRIEAMLDQTKAKKALTIIKQYYLKGKMPKWEDLKYWDNYDRHLDILCFLWLHPSSDLKVLQSLYETYMTSEAIHEGDALRGYSEFLSSHMISTASPYQSMDDFSFPFTGSKALTIFKVFYNDTDFIKDQITRHLGSPERFNHEGRQVVFGLGFPYICIMGGWLIIEKMLPLHEECLFQYNEVLDWCYLSFSQDKSYFEENSDKVVIDQYYTALYRIHHFDTEKEGDTCKTRYVHKMRKILDEREFIPEFKQMWLDIKVGKIEVENPWKS